MKTYAVTAAPVNGKRPGTNDPFVYATPHTIFGMLYHYYGRFEVFE